MRPPAGNSGFVPRRSRAESTRVCELRHPPRELGRRDNHQFGRRPCQADVEELVEPVALGRELDEDDDLALHPLEAADRLEEDLVRLVGDPLRRETLRSAVVVERLVAEDSVPEATVTPG